MKHLFLTYFIFSFVLTFSQEITSYDSLKTNSDLLWKNYLCFPGADSARKDAQKCIYVYLLNETVSVTDSFSYFDKYLLDKYNINLKASCPMKYK